MLELVDDAMKSGAKLVMGGEVPEDFAKGAYMTPALLVDVTDDMRVSKGDLRADHSDAAVQNAGRGD